MAMERGCDGLEKERKRGEYLIFACAVLIINFISSATSPDPSSHAAASSNIFCPCNLAGPGTSVRVFRNSDISIPTLASSQPQSLAQRLTPELQLHPTLTRAGTPCIILSPIPQLPRRLWRNVTPVFLWFRDAHESGKQHDEWKCRR